MQLIDLLRSSIILNWNFFNLKNTHHIDGSQVVGFD